MLFSKTLAVGIVLAFLSGLSHGRAIKYSKEVPNDIDHRSAGPFSCSKTYHAVDSDFPLTHVTSVNCWERISSGVPDISLPKRAPPKVPGRAGKDGDSIQDGSSLQAGSARQGDDTQAGSQTGGDKPGNDPNAGVASGAAGVAESPPAPGTAAILEGYADIPRDFDFRGKGRVPGENKLPMEIPNYRGLSESAEDAFRRASFQRFVNWDIQASINIPADGHFFLFIGQEARNARATWKPEFNNDRKHTDGLSSDDRGRLVDAEDLYNGINTGDNMVPVPPGMDVGAPGNWMSMLQSYGIAKRAAQKGGILRILGEGTVDPVTGNKVIYKERLNQEGSYMYNFELQVVTSPESNVKQIFAYNTLNRDSPPEILWRQGDAPMGKEPDWIAGTLPESERAPIPPARQPTPESINLDDAFRTPSQGSQESPEGSAKQPSPGSERSGDSLDQGFVFGGDSAQTVNLDDAL